MISYLHGANVNDWRLINKYFKVGILTDAYFEKNNWLKSAIINVAFSLLTWVIVFVTGSYISYARFHNKI